MYIYIYILIYLDYLFVYVILQAFLQDRTASQRSRTHVSSSFRCLGGMNTSLTNNFWGNSLWTYWEFHPLKLRSCLSQTL